MAGETEHLAIERRIERFIILVGVTVTVGAGIGWGFRAAGSAAIGAILCAVNFQWLRHGATALMRIAMTQTGAEQVHVPRSVQVKFLGRLVLLLAVAYVILTLLRLPAVPFLCGAVAVVPAILIELIYELAHGQHR
jgi:hypothetical protein